MSRGAASAYGRTRSINAEAILRTSSRPVIMDTVDFLSKSRRLSGVVSGWLDSMTKTLGVNVTHDGTDGRFDDASPLFAGTNCKMSMLVHRRYLGDGTILEGWDVVPDRFIKIEIGHTDGEALRVFITSSALSTPPIDMIGSSEAALWQAVMSVNGELFIGFPLSRDEITELMRRHIPDFPDSPE